MSKDIGVSFWIDFSEFYGELSLQEVLGGNLVVVNENVHAEFAEFRGKLQSYIGRTCCMIKGIELLKVWCRSTKTTLLLSFLSFDVSPPFQQVRTNELRMRE